MYTATATIKLPTTIIGSLPRPHWYTENLGTRSFRDAMVDQRFREQYLDAVATCIKDQEVAGLDILTDGELRLMRVLWNEGRATVAGVWSGLPKRDRPAYKSVQTLLRILEDKGYVRHEKAGRAFVYVPLVDREGARGGAVARLLRQFFDDKPGALALNILERGQLEPGELTAIRRLLAPSVLRMAASYTRRNFVIETAPIRISEPLKSTSAPTTVTPSVTLSTTLRIVSRISRRSMIDTFGNSATTAACIRARSRSFCGPRTVEM